MKKNIYKLACIGAVLAFNACSLDPYDPNKVTGDEKLTERETFEGLVNQCYTPLFNALYQSSDYVLFAEGGTDLWEEPTRSDSYQRYHSYDGLLPGDGYLKKVWRFSMNTIAICNSVCERAENAEGLTEAEREEMVAQARCLRAFYYYILTEQFGDVALTLKGTGTGEVDLYPTRSSVAEIYAQIIADLKYAVEKLPVSFSNYGRVTRKTAKGLLCRAYIQGAAYGLKDEDGVDYLQKAYDTATDFIAHKDEYNAYLYNDFADVFNEKNNRNNKEFLFVATGAKKDSEAYNSGNYSQCEVFRHFLPKLGEYTDLGLVDKTSNFIYGRPNSNVFLPSKYLMECFAQDMNDTRFRYSFITAYSGYSIAARGDEFAYGNGQNYSKVIDDKLIDTYEIDSRWKGTTIYEHFELINNGTDELGVWKPDGSGYINQKDTEGNILHPALPLAHPVEGEDWQYCIYCSLEKLTDEERAEYPCFVNNIFDLYDAEGVAKTTTDFGNNSASTRQTSIYPALSKFNMPGEEFYGLNAQRKTVDMPIMRFAEVYLIAAEAAVRLGKTDAKQYIDVLRTRAHASEAPANIDMEYIYDEYARELCGEYSRWYLLKRNHAFEARLSKYNKRAAANFRADRDYLRPIPQEFLDAIYNAEEFGQNPGY